MLYKIWFKLKRTFLKAHDVFYVILNRNYPFTDIDKDIPQTPENSCVPSPCGPFAICRDSGYAGVPTCTCLENYIGSPPNCRPECTVDSECNNNRACLRQKCRDPCLGSCGIGAQCLVINHMAVCLCPKGYTGDAFANCFPEPSRKHLFLLFRNISSIRSIKLCIHDVKIDLRTILIIRPIRLDNSLYPRDLGSISSTRGLKA